jgi:hypothetical protein
MEGIMLKSLLWQQIKKPMTFYLMFGIVLLILINMAGIENRRENRPFPGHDSNLNTSYQVNFSESFLNMGKDREKYPLAASSFDFFDQTSYAITRAAMMGDSKETVRLNILSELMLIKLHRDSNLPIDRELLKKDIYDIWNRVSNGVPYDSIDFRPEFASKGTEAQLLLEVRYWDTLFQHDIEPIYDDEANNITVWYYFMYNIGPIIFILIPILVAYASINSDINSGVLKLLLTQSVTRPKYYFGKWVVNVIQTISIILVPPLIMGVFYGVKNGFVSLIYPVTYLSNLWTRVKPIPNYIEVIFSDGTQTKLGRSTFMHMAPANDFTTDFIQPYQGIDLIPFWLYALIGLLILILYICLITALVQIISAMFNNGIVSFAISTVVIGGGIGMTQYMTIGEHYNVIPLNFFRIGRIIEGTQNVTVLVAVLILILSSGILLLGGYKYFERKAV